MNLDVAVSLAVFAFVLWGIPIIFVVSDPIISKKEKAIWVFAIWLGSWVAWFLYQYVAPILPRQKLYDSDNDETRDQVSPTL